MKNETMKKAGILILRLAATFIALFAIEYIMGGHTFRHVNLLHILCVTAIFNACLFTMECLVSRMRKSITSCDR